MPAQHKNKQALSAVAHQKIQDLILTLELEPGSAVDEMELGEELSIVRTPSVRLLSA